MKIFQDTWAKYVSDDDYKNRQPTEVEVSLAYLKSGEACPITEDALTDDNTVIEHFDCKSKHSETEYRVVSSTGNQWKSNRTPDENRKVLTYQESK